MDELHLLFGVLRIDWWVQHAKQRIGRGVLAGILGFAFVVAIATVITALIAAAIYWALQPSLGPVWAAGSTAAIFILVLVILGIIALRQLRAPPQIPRQPLLPALTEAELGDLLSPQSLRGLLSLLVLGVVLGLSRRRPR